jgi:gamma-glutamylcyclotransferase (GGCT)/AIG2-like uncharacterized protein YtfP
MINLFAYGTLMCEEIMYEVAGCHPAHDPGVLRGYIRRSVAGENYPAIIQDGESIVNGLIYYAVPGSAWERLDRFEGERIQLTIDVGLRRHPRDFREKENP